MPTFSLRRASLTGRATARGAGLEGVGVVVVSAIVNESARGLGCEGGGNCGVLC